MDNGPFRHSTQGPFLNDRGRLGVQCCGVADQLASKRQNGSRIIGIARQLAGNLKCQHSHRIRVHRFLPSANNGCENAAGERNLQLSRFELAPPSKSNNFRKWVLTSYK
jgi:hypothetical protein